MDKAFFALLGVIVGALLNDFTATKREKRKRLYDAMDNLRRTFAKELTKYDHLPINIITIDVIFDSVQKIDTAVTEFHFKFGKDHIKDIKAYERADEAFKKSCTDFYKCYDQIGTSDETGELRSQLSNLQKKAVFLLMELTHKTSLKDQIKRFVSIS